MNKNIILKTIEEVHTLIKFTEREISWKKKFHSLFLTQTKFLEFSELREYFLENEINDFSKKEVVGLAKLCFVYIELFDEYESIKNEDSHFCYKFKNSKTGEVSVAWGDGELRCYLIVDDKFLYFRDESKFESLFRLENQYLIGGNYHIWLVNMRKILTLCCEVVGIDDVRDLKLRKNQNPELSDEKVFNLEKNKFDKVEPNKVVEHFYKLVENKYITQADFNLFIENLFGKNQNLTSKISILKPNSKGKVKRIFYQYYDTIQSEKYCNKDKYLKLLTENFSGFNYKALESNFSK